MERFKTMSPDEQKQFIARMKERGGDTSAFEAATADAKRGEGAGEARRPSGAAAARDDRRAVRAAAAGRNARPRVAVHRTSS